MSADLTRREVLAGAAALAVAAGVAARGERAMIRIPAGPVTLGTNPDQAARLAAEFACHVSWLVGESPRQVELPDYWIDRLPVTQAQYAAFVEATGHRLPQGWHQGRPVGLDDHPITGVAHEDALAYAAWAGLRLPTEDEWEKAARGPDSLTWPWGHEFDPTACCWDRTGDPGTPTTDAVGSHPRGASPYGVLDMAGQVAEWTADKPSPVTAVMKGGAWITRTPLTLRGACRLMSGWATNQANFYGFRCARDG